MQTVQAPHLIVPSLFCKVGGREVGGGWVGGMVLSRKHIKFLILLVLRDEAFEPCGSVAYSL